MNDPYVVERILCASYGAAMRSQDVDGLEHLAKLSYDVFFATTPQCDHILIRDYALGLILLAVENGIALSVDPTRLEPPFETEGFDPELTTGAIKKKYGLEEGGWKDGYRPAWSQIDPGGTDFGIYQVSSTIQKFASYSGGNRDTRNLHSIVPAWMLQAMIDMGWANDLQEANNLVNHHRQYDRHDQEKPETLTKKYAWIALHRAEGIMADHYKEEIGWGCDAEWRFAHGPWEKYRRDLDPSLLIPLEQTKGGESEKSSQWFPAGTIVPDWRPDVDDEAWMSDSNNLPVVDSLLPWTLADGKEYLMLQSFKTERRPVSPLEADGKPTRDSYLFVWSYFVPVESAEKAYRWFKRQNFFSKWMPEASSSKQAFIGEFHWHPASDREGELRQPIPPGSHCFSFRQKVPPPCDLLISTDEYSWGSGYDTTCRTDFNFLIPCNRLIETLELHRHGDLPPELKAGFNSSGFQEAAWFTKEGRCVAFAPDVYRPGPSALFVSRDALLEFLRKQKLALCWTFLGERRSYVHGLGSERVRPPGQAVINGAGMLTQDNTLRSKVRCDYRPL